MEYFDNYSFYAYDIYKYTLSGNHPNVPNGIHKLIFVFHFSFDNINLSTNDVKITKENNTITHISIHGCPSIVFSKPVEAEIEVKENGRNFFITMKTNEEPSFLDPMGKYNAYKANKDANILNELLQMQFPNAVIDNNSPESDEMKEIESIYSSNSKIKKLIEEKKHQQIKKEEKKINTSVQPPTLKLKPSGAKKQLVLKKKTGETERKPQIGHPKPQLVPKNKNPNLEKKKEGEEVKKVISAPSPPSIIKEPKHAFTLGKTTSKKIPVYEYIPERDNNLTIKKKYPKLILSGELHCEKIGDQQLEISGSIFEEQKYSDDKKLINYQSGEKNKIEISKLPVITDIMRFSLNKLHDNEATKQRYIEQYNKWKESDIHKKHAKVLDFSDVLEQNYEITKKTNK